MRNKFLILSMLLLVCFVTACGNKSSSDALKFKEEYESLNGQALGDTGLKYRSVAISEDNPFVYKTAGEIVKMIERRESFVVYFGFSNCPWCRSVIGTLINVAKDNGLSTIYYVDVKEIRDTMTIDESGNIITSKKGSDDYYKLLTLLEPVLDDYTLTNKAGESVLAGEKRIYAPNVVSIVGGVAKELETGISALQTDAFMELTEEMVNETYNKFKCSIKCVLENKNTCSSESQKAC